MDPRGQNARKPIRIEITDPAVASTIHAALRALAASGVGKDTAALLAAVEPLRPWSDWRAVERSLTEWALAHEAYGWDFEDDDAADVAVELEKLGRATVLPDARRLESMLVFMLVNIRAGRAAGDDGDRLAQFAGRIMPKRTQRRYKARYGRDAVPEYLKSLIYKADMQGLVAGGRSPAAARQWLRTNQGKHWRDAPSPRKRQSETRS